MHVRERVLVHFRGNVISGETSLDGFDLWLRSGFSHLIYIPLGLQDGYIQSWKEVGTTENNSILWQGERLTWDLRIKNSPSEPLGHFTARK